MITVAPQSDELHSTVADSPARRAATCPMCSAAERAEADYFARASSTATPDTNLITAAVAAGGYCASHAALALNIPDMALTFQSILVQLAPRTVNQLQHAQAILQKRGVAHLPETATCPICDEQRHAVTQQAAAIISSLDRADASRCENLTSVLCFRHLLSMLAGDSLDSAACTGIVAARHHRLASLLSSQPYAQKLATHSRLPDPAVVDAVLRELAGDPVKSAVRRERSSPGNASADFLGLVQSSSVIADDCPVCQRLCHAWQTRLAMLDGNAEGQLDIYDLMPAAPHNVWAMCNQAQGDGLRRSIAAAGAYRMLAEYESLLLHCRPGKHSGRNTHPTVGIRGFFDALIERHRARKAFIAACHHPFTCPVDRYIRSVTRHQLSRLLTELHDPEISDAYGRSSGLCMVHLRSALALAPDIGTAQALLQSASARNQQILRQADTSSDEPTHPLKSALLFFSGTDHRYGKPHESAH